MVFSSCCGVYCFRRSSSPLSSLPSSLPSSLLDSSRTSRSLPRQDHAHYVLPPPSNRRAPSRLRFHRPFLLASPAPFNDMQASLWPSQLQRVAMGCSVTVCRRLSTAPAGVHVSARTVQHVYFFVLSAASRIAFRYILPFVFVRCDCSPTFHFCNMSQQLTTSAENYR